jgi:hypothetical protein
MNDDPDEIHDALRRWRAATPFGDHRSIGPREPVTHFPHLNPRARTPHPSEWANMMRAIARIPETADIGYILAFEAATYLARQERCQHAWVTVNDHRRPPYSECPYCERRR